MEKIKHIPQIVLSVKKGWYCGKWNCDAKLHIASMDQLKITENIFHVLSYFKYKIPWFFPDFFYSGLPDQVGTVIEIISDPGHLFTIFSRVFLILVLNLA